MGEGDRLTLKSKSKLEGVQMTEDERREAALASAGPLQPTFKPPLGVSQQQLSKFQELHRRRLLIKSKSKSYDKPQANKSKRPKKTTDTKNGSVKTLEDGERGSDCSRNNKLDANASLQSDDGSSHYHVSKKQRQKLHWGLDTKDRWEMKANM